MGLTVVTDFYRSKNLSNLNIHRNRESLSFFRDGKER